MSNPVGVIQPAEWAPHRAVWTAWPSHPELWLDLLPRVQAEVAALCRAIAAPNAAGQVGEQIELLVPPERVAEALAALRGCAVRTHAIPFGDVWLRDTAPIFVRQGDGGIAAACFRFNGWGEKYLLPGDAQVAERVAGASGVPAGVHDFVLEGGSVEVDGEGTCLTTRQCLLNPNRNPGLDAAALEARLRKSLGVERVLWLDEGLQNDHTDGHIDTLARFVAPGVVVCMEPSGTDDPNAAALVVIARDLRAMRDARGRALEVITVPSPGLLLGDEGEPLPASYVNFYIGNHTVVVPTYGTPYDDAAVAAIAECFPRHHTVGASARAILEGGGAFHCITQQEPERS